MRNVKGEVYAALQNANITEHLSDGFPKDPVAPGNTIIVYNEVQNSVYEWVNGRESKSNLEYLIEIWHDESTSSAALAVDAAISALGLRRTMCQDVNGDPSGWKHKVMRYKGILDLDNDNVLWNN